MQLQLQHTIIESDQTFYLFDLFLWNLINMFETVANHLRDAPNKH